MIKKTFITLTAMFAIIALTGCESTSPETSDTTSTTDAEKLTVAATIFPVYDITRNVAGDLADVELILAPGASPHTFDPTPSALTKLQNAKRIFAIGQDIDSWSYGIASNIPGVEVIEVDRNIALRASSDPHDDHEDEHEDEDEHAHEDEHEHAHVHGELDPHYWLDPNNAVIMVNTIADELSELDPDNEDQYRKNAATFTTVIQKENVTWQNALSSLPERKLVTFHGAFFYFANHFDLNVVATFEPFPGKEPTPSYLQELEHEIEEHDIQVLFTEPQLHGASLEQFAKDHGLTVYILDPLGGVNGRESYVELINYNVQTVAEALQ